MTRTLLLVCLLACALPAAASASTLSITTPPTQTYNYKHPQVDITTTVSGTSDQAYQKIEVAADPSDQPCAATVADETGRGHNSQGTAQVAYTTAGAYSQTMTIELVNVSTPSEWKFCAYLLDPQASESATPLATAATDEFKLWDPNGPAGAGRAQFSFITPQREAKRTITLQPGDRLWLGGSFGYGVNPMACAAPNEDVTWFSNAFKGVATTRSHGEPAVISKTDSLSGLTLRLNLSRSLKPGSYPIGLACADGSLAASKRVLHVAGSSKAAHKHARKHHKRKHRRHH